MTLYRYFSQNVTMHNETFFVFLNTVVEFMSLRTVEGCCYYFFWGGGG